jgi:hypothetical protein
VFGLGGGKYLLLVGELVDQVLGVVGGCPHASNCKWGVRQSPLMWIRLTNRCPQSSPTQERDTLQHASRGIGFPGADR